MKKSLVLSIFFTLVFFTEILAGGPTLEYRLGDSAEITITQKVEVHGKALGMTLNDEETGTIRMEVTVLDEGKEGSPLEVQVIVREYSCSEDDDTAKKTIADHLIDRPLSFSICDPYRVIENTDILDALAELEEQEVISSFGTSHDFYNYTLGQLLHLKGVPLVAEKSVSVPIIDWFDYEDEPFSRNDSEIVDTGKYTIQGISKDRVHAYWRGNASYVNGDDRGTLSMSAKVVWNRQNPLLQQRNLTLRVQENRNIFQVPIEANTVLEQKWVSRPVNKG